MTETKPKEAPKPTAPKPKTGGSTSLNFTRDDYVLLCDLAMQSERYEEMIGFIKKFADGEQELNKE